MVYSDERRILMEIIPYSERMQEKLDAKLLWEEISALLSDEQTELLRMRADGFSTHEIAASQNRGNQDIEDMFADIQESVLNLCLT
jgi:predicted DNA-binding protein YlxM (UPF0122 family)